jgi:hypothetical protein
MLTVSQLSPTFCEELQDLVQASSRPELAPQLAALPVVDRCDCGQGDCAHFYTAPRPDPSYGPLHSNVVLNSDRGLLVLDVVDDAVVGVEVLDRPDVKACLDRAMPLHRRVKQQGILPCPACGFLTVSDKTYGSYNICDMCGWEDDGVQLANPACSGGANHISLVDAQDRALAKFPLDIAEASGVLRAPSWRPLSDLERDQALAQRTEKYWMNAAVQNVAQCYWNR